METGEQVLAVLSVPGPRARWWAGGVATGRRDIDRGLTWFHRVSWVWAGVWRDRGFQGIGKKSLPG